MPPQLRVHPGEINGDLPLSREEREAYLAYHAERNAANAARSRELGVRTRPLPIARVSVPGAVSPARWAVSQFFDLAAATLKPRFADRPVTILDLGCGRGDATLPFFAAHGYHGRYLGLDLAKHPKWNDKLPAGFTKELILSDVHEIDPRSLPPIDLLVSATCLEHIRDDRGVLARLAACLAPGAAQAHFVPGEAALPLYTTHGWRQYSPACLRDLFPEGEIYRAGGRASSCLHERSLTTPGPRGPLHTRRPALYRAALRASLAIDRLFGQSPPTMYGVIVRPDSAHTATMPARQAA